MKLNNKSLSAGGIVLNNKNQVIIVNNKSKSWTFPKGHIEPNEDPLTAAKREIFEETGISNLKFIKNLGTYDREKFKPKKGKSIKRIFMFLFESDQKELNPIDPNNPEAKWIDKEQVLNIFTYQEERLFYLKILSSL